MTEKLKSEIKSLISENQTEEALIKLKRAFAGKPGEKDLILISNRFNSIERQIAIATISHDNATIEINKINAALLDFLDTPELETTATRTVKGTGSGEKKGTSWWIWIIFIFFSGVIAFYLITSEENGNGSDKNGSDKQDNTTYYFSYFSENVPSDLKDIIESLRTQNYAVKNVSVSPSNGWVVLYGRNATYYKGISQEAVTKLQELADADDEIRQVVLGPNSQYLITGNKNGWQSGMPQDMMDKLWALHYQGISARQVELGPNLAWLIIGTNNDFWYNGMPLQLINKLNEVKTRGNIIKHVDIGPSWQWVVLEGTNGYWLSPSYSQTLLDKLKELHDTNREIKSVSLLDNGGWILFY